LTFLNPFHLITNLAITNWEYLIYNQKFKDLQTKVTNLKMRLNLKSRDGMTCTTKLSMTWSIKSKSQTLKDLFNKSKFWLIPLKIKKIKLANFKLKFNRFKMINRIKLKMLNFRNWRKRSKKRWLNLNFCWMINQPCMRRCTQRPF